MSELGIQFIATMARAILDGQKTQTRRVWKLPKWAEWDAVAGGEAAGQLIPKDPDLRGWYSVDEIECPYGQPGGLLWVKEEWAEVSQIGMPLPVQKIIYRADNPNLGPWRSAFHMPRRASRITLETTAIRVERLQDISVDDCVAEGCGAETWWPESNTRAQYQRLWDDLYGAGSWDANPWVWVIDFELVKP